jgi:hypothetical protein
LTPLKLYGIFSNPIPENRRVGYEKNKALLEEYIRSRGLTKAGAAVWARYDPPFMPWFLRRNEVLILVEKFH